MKNIEYSVRSKEECAYLEEAIDKFFDEFSILPRVPGILRINKGPDNVVGINPIKPMMISEVKNIKQKDKNSRIVTAGPEFITLDLNETRYIISYKGI